MDRRSFLQALIGLGAAVALPLKATDAQVDKAWNELCQDPFLFAVREGGAIYDPDSPDPQVNRV